MWERRALVDISHRLREPLDAMRRRNRVRDEATDVSTHVQYEAWLKHRSNARAPGERLVVDESVTVRDRHAAADEEAAADSMRHGNRRTALDSASVQRQSRLGSVLMGKNKKRAANANVAAADADARQPSQALYLYRLFADADIAEAAGGQWYARLDCELSDAGQRPLFIGIDDDLKAASAHDMARHRRRFEWLMARHWSQPAPWELPGEVDGSRSASAAVTNRVEVDVDAAEAAQLQCVRAR
jgi:hypothetical protein